MTRKIALVLLLFALPAQAAPRWLTAVPRAVGRSYGNMFTFKHPWVAAQQWGQVGAILLDEKTTQDAFGRCPTCCEMSPFTFRRRNGTIGAIGDAVALTAIEGTYTKYRSEVAQDDGEKNGWVRNAYAIWPAFTIGMHVSAAIGNTTVAPKP